MPFTVKSKRGQIKDDIRAIFNLHYNQKTEENFSILFHPFLSNDGRLFVFRFATVEHNSSRINKMPEMVSRSESRSQNLPVNTRKKNDG